MACRSDERTPRQVAVLRSGGHFESWVEGSGAAPSGLSVEEVSWQGPRATDIHGLFLQSDASRSGSGHAHAGSLVLLIHGGPSLAHHHSFDPHHANRLLEAGYCVLLANQRGGPGRGSEFAMANHGDPGGAELEDVLSGADFLMSSGRVRQQAPAVMGSSYGGYLSALAAVTRPVACAVVGAGMSDLTSARHTCNNAPFYDLLLGGPPSETSRPATLRRAVGRLPMQRRGGPHAHTARRKRQLRARRPGPRAVRSPHGGWRRGGNGDLSTRGPPDHRARARRRLLVPSSGLALVPLRSRSLTLTGDELELTRVAT